MIFSSQFPTLLKTPVASMSQGLRPSTHRLCSHPKSTGSINSILSTRKGRLWEVANWLKVIYQLPVKFRSVYDHNTAAENDGHSSWKMTFWDEGTGGTELPGARNVCKPTRSHCVSSTSTLGQSRHCHVFSACLLARVPFRAGEPGQGSLDLGRTSHELTCTHTHTLS